MPQQSPSFLLHREDKHGNRIANELRALVDKAHGVEQAHEDR